MKDELSILENYLISEIESDKDKVIEQIATFIDVEFVFNSLVEKGLIDKDSLDIYDNKHKSYEMFEELYQKYPSKTPSGRALRTNKDTCKKRYANFIKGNEEQHKLVLKLLDFEINYRKETNAFDFMKQLPTWINQKEWETYADLMKFENGVETLRRKNVL